MRYFELREKIKQNVFNFLDVVKFFPQENEHNLKIQINRFIKAGYIKRIKRGLYAFDLSLVDELELANKLYSPSYISLETALSYYGVIPEVSLGVTSVSTVTTKKIENQFGTFYFVKIDHKLFFGYKIVSRQKNEGSFLIAEKEKALLDFFYCRKISKIESLRLNFEEFDYDIYKKYSKEYPEWVEKIKIR